MNIKKICITVITIITIIIFIPAPSFAIPGQLIYDVPSSPSAPIQTITTQCDQALVACTTVSQSYQLKNKELEKANTTLAANLAEEKKRGVIIEVAGGILIITVGILLFLLRKKSSPSETNY